MTPSLVLERSPAVSDDVESATRLARQLGRPALVSRTESLPALPDPLAFLEAGARALGHGVLWDHSAANQAFAGAGAAAIITAEGASRFGSVTSSIADLAARLVRDDEAALFPLLGGFAFAPRLENAHLWRDFPDALLVVPRACLQISDGVALLRVTAPVVPEADPIEIDRVLGIGMGRARQWAMESLAATRQNGPIERHTLPNRRVWESSVAAAVSLIRRGLLDKVVLAREERLRFASAVSPAAVLARLRETDPDATRFAMQSHDSWFIGSTPERLVRLYDGRVDVTCLAGSIAMGRDDDETAALAARLLASAKDREEHDFVVRSAMQALADVCEDVAPAAGSPLVRKARSVQHLETAIVAHMASAGRVLDLAERLHPTPAVGGFPRDRALAVIRELEAFDRGWYAGPIGWTDLGSDGEFAVAIRSALLTGQSASLFAGCGIVADSNPAAEWDETCLKLRPMLAAMDTV